MDVNDPAISRLTSIDVIDAHNHQQSAHQMEEPVEQVGMAPRSRSRSKSKSKSRSVPRHGRSSTLILKRWFASHAEWPYPSHAEKDFLSQKTGMSIKQISHWFVNTRRRNGPKLAEAGLSLSSQNCPAASDGALASMASSTAPVEIQPRDDAQLDQWSQMSPLDRWQHTPPEQEPVSLQAVVQAAQADNFEMQSGFLQDTSWMGLDNNTVPPSLNSFDFPSSGDSSASSAYSQSSAQSSNSIYSFDSFTSANGNPRLGRRKRRNTTMPTQSRLGRRKGDDDDDVDARPYQCTFCTDRFKSRYDWTRHEKSLHLVLERWICLPLGPTHQEYPLGPTQCALCDMPNPQESHLGTHHVAECMAKPLNSRTFFRKDHLRQHLRVSHDIHNMTKSMEAWKTNEINIKSRCGFCSETFATWPERNDHLTDHFRAGAEMRDWKGCRGLEPVVALRVENAMPPYLIGIESTDPEPFSASRGTGKKSSAPFGANSCNKPPTSFESLTARLGDYVRIAKENNLDLGDEALRRQARLILYDDEDPWNQTPADNAEWLAMFKLGYGMDVDATHQESEKLATLDQGLVTSPFTMQRLNLAAGSHQTLLPFCSDNLSGQIGSTGMQGLSMAVPWSWQTPECLAEFSQLCQIPDGAMACPSADKSLVGLADLDSFSGAHDSSAVPDCLLGSVHAPPSETVNNQFDEILLDAAFLFEPNA